MVGLTVPWQGFTCFSLHHLPALFKLEYSFLVPASLKQNKREQSNVFERNGRLCGHSVWLSVAWSELMRRWHQRLNPVGTGWLPRRVSLGASGFRFGDVPGGFSYVYMAGMWEGWWVFAQGLGAYEGRLT